MAAACASHKTTQPASSATTAAAQSTDTTLPGPEAKIHISYSHQGDFLTSLVVTEYASADPLRDVAEGKDLKGTIVRFEGGVVVWQIGVEKSLLSSMPLIGKDQPYAASEVKYGTMPPHFVSIVPETGPPEPLDPDHYYIFTVNRASGSTSYEAVKVNGDGSLEAYEAEPRAGTSFRICCNVAPDFVINAAGNAPAEAPPP
ncbi:MAG TPA: hypothetical protein VJN94_07970 [Candidatus Binataceae bacterium]|nr:hypothetical protein [Candidatus Binataceae bacterium]